MLKRSKKPVAPLRKIVRRIVEEKQTRNQGLTYRIHKELLECGHVVMEKVDMCWPTNAERRRCGRCLREESLDVT